MKKRVIAGSLGGLALLLAFITFQRPETDTGNTDWKHYGGDSGGSRYSALSQINVSNIGKLQPAWTFDTGENKDTTGRGMDIQCQPIVVNGVLYGTTPRMKLFAINAATGEEYWKFDPFEDPNVKPRFHPLRGVSYWEDKDDKRILYAVGPTLYAIDAKSGKRITSFGKNGEVSLYEGVGGQELGYDVRNYTIRSTSPGAIYKDLIIM
mgnify:CR=1 FL=1